MKLKIVLTQFHGDHPNAHMEVVAVDSREHSSFLPRRKSAQTVGEHLTLVCQHLAEAVAHVGGAVCASLQCCHGRGSDALELANEVANEPDGEGGSRYVLIPTSRWKERWDTAIMFFILYSAYVVPLRVCFHHEAEGAVWVFEASLSVIFEVDLLLSFNTAFFEDGVWVRSHERIAWRYLVGWFWIDAPSSAPTELIELATHSHDTDSLAMLRVLRIARLVRLLRLLKVTEILRHVEEAFDINLRAFRLVQLTFKLSYVAHIMGCFWWYMHTWSAEHDIPSWLSVYDPEISLATVHEQCALQSAGADP